MKDFTKNAFAIRKCCKPHRNRGIDCFTSFCVDSNNEISERKCCKKKCGNVSANELLYI